MMKNIIKIVVFVVTVIAVGFLFNKYGNPTKLSDKEQKELSNKLRDKFKNQNPNDSTMIESRQIGNISLDKFIALALRAHKSDFDTTCVKRDGDSILFVVKQPKMFYGADAGKWWTKKYTNSPIRILDNNSFKAKINEINGKEYLYIPYHILSCLVDFIGESDSLKSTQKTEKDEKGRYITIRSEKDLQGVVENGSKIQTEGWVFKNVSDIITQSGYNGGDKYNQIEILWKFVRAHWTYISDPNFEQTGGDTWRSAPETIENYYFTSAKRYTGDCDDFAILMASFARQIGFRSRFVITMGAQGGHAYAEFYSEKDSKWINMDWNDDHLGGTPYGRRVKVYEDL